MLNTTFAPWPSYSEEEAQAVTQVLLSNRVNYWTGSVCRDFEQAFADWCGARYAVSMMNGTVALDAALKALEIGEGDEVIVTSRTFLASVSSIVNAGAKPVFADVDMDSQTITPETVKPMITAKTKAIVCVHLAGWPCDMPAFMALAQAQGLNVIEDCAQAHGARINGQSVGTFGHVSAWSFCQDKIMTTGGEGGMVTTNDQQLWSAIWSYKDHGKSWSAVYEQAHPPGFRWLHESFGTNWRMTEMQAAIGLIQLTRMASWHQTRQRHAQAIFAAARGCPALRVPTIPADIEHAFYKCYVFVKPQALAEGWDRDRIIDQINQRGVPCYSGSCAEVYLEKAFDNTDFRPTARLSNAQQLGETALMFLVHPSLTQAQIERTCLVLRQVMQQAQGGVTL
jgi:dTDP-4-amino-4,6-dideoxygalactose transaminase